MTIDYGIERDLRAIPAEKELLQLKLLRAVGKATDEGVPQRTIAVMLGVAQPEVSRIVKKLRLNPAARDRSPREVMLEHAGGRISREQMISELAGWEYTFGRVAVDDPVGSRIGGVRGIRSSVRAIFSPTRIAVCCSGSQRTGVRRRMHSDRVEAVAAETRNILQTRPIVGQRRVKRIGPGPRRTLTQHHLSSARSWISLICRDAVRGRYCIWRAGGVSGLPADAGLCRK